MTAPAAERSDHAVSLGELEGSLGFLLRIAQVHTFERFYETFSGIDLRPGEYTVMWVIRRNPGIRQGLLAETLGIKPAQMTKMIRKLEDMGRIRRIIPDSDRRSVELFLTAGGEAFIDAHRKAFFGHEDPADFDLSPEEWRQLAHLLRRYTGIEKRPET